MCTTAFKALPHKTTSMAVFIYLFFQILLTFDDIKINCMWSKSELFWRIMFAQTPILNIVIKGLAPVQNQVLIVIEVIEADQTVVCALLFLSEWLLSRQLRVLVYLQVWLQLACVLNSGGECCWDLHTTGQNGPYYPLCDYLTHVYVFHCWMPSAMKSSSCWRERDT